MRGETDELRGESGGVLLPANMDGNEMLSIAVVLVVEFPRAFKGAPVFTSASKDFTYI